MWLTSICIKERDQSTLLYPFRPPALLISQLPVHKKIEKFIVISAISPIPSVQSAMNFSLVIQLARLIIHANDVWGPFIVTKTIDNNIMDPGVIPLKINVYYSW